MWRVYIRQCLMYLTYHFLLRLSCNGITFLFAINLFLALKLTNLISLDMRFVLYFHIE